MPASDILDLVYPRMCASCARPLDVDPGYMCWECLARLEIIVHPFCSKCGDPVDGMVEDRYVCSWCGDRGPAFDAARSAARYRGPLVTLIQAFKYGGMTCLSPHFVDLLCGCVRTHFPREHFEAVVSVPLHPGKERARTFNQSGILAAGLAGRLGIPVFSRGLVRVRQTETQTCLTSRQRRENVRKAFRTPAAEWVAGRRLLLVDDIMTTGATVNECSRVLMQADAASVHVVTVARG